MTSRSRAISANGLASRRFACAQAGDGRRVGGVAGELKAAQPLDRDDLPAEQAARPRHVDRIVAGGEGVIAAPTVPALQPGARAAGGAGDRLGVEAPVGGVGVFGRARGAHAGTRAWWCVARS